MRRILFNSPKNGQVLIEINNDAKVINTDGIVWDEKLDEAIDLAEDKIGGYEKINGSIIFRDDLKAQDVAKKKQVSDRLLDEKQKADRSKQVKTQLKQRLVDQRQLTPAEIESVIKSIMEII